MVQGHSIVSVKLIANGGLEYMHPIRDISDVASAVEKLGKRGIIFSPKLNWYHCKLFLWYQSLCKCHIDGSVAVISLPILQIAVQIRES